jgi:hypothetical protein
MWMKFEMKLACECWAVINYCWWSNWLSRSLHNSNFSKCSNVHFHVIFLWKQQRRYDDEMKRTSHHVILNLFINVRELCLFFFLKWIWIISFILLLLMKRLHSDQDTMIKTKSKWMNRCRFLLFFLISIWILKNFFMLNLAPFFRVEMRVNVNEKEIFN